MRNRERQLWMELIEAEREAHRKERQELLNRIARPNMPVVDPVQVEPTPPREDRHELAFIGQEVPEGVAVGSLRVEGANNGAVSS